MDFSKISTEKLREAVERYTPTYCCAGINCSICPFATEECGSKIELINKQFKQELERRERMEMPELKAGMIVEISGVKYFFINNDWICRLDKDLWMFISSNEEIDKIFKTSKKTLDDIKKSEYLELIWSKESPNQKKIKEIENTIEDLKRQVKELKEDK